jgi:hypothetical protein
LGAKLIGSNAIFGVRRIPDLSGDGHNNTGLPIAHARNDALARGIVINGLVGDTHQAHNFDRSARLATR